MNFAALSCNSVNSVNVFEWFGTMIPDFPGFLLDPILLNDAARAVHLVGLALGLGVALIADLSASRSLHRPLTTHELDTLKWYHQIVFAGLLLFWVSGLFLLWLRTGFVLEEFSPKLNAKLVVVSVLSLNAVLIGRVGMPTLVAFEGSRFGSMPTTERYRLAVIAGLSGASWASAFALGTFSQMKTMDWPLLAELVGCLYLLGLLAALCAATLAPRARRLEEEKQLVQIYGVRPRSRSHSHLHGT